MRNKRSGRPIPEFEIVEHTADWSIRVRGADLGGLLVSAAYGMASLLVADLDALTLNEERLLEIRAFDRESMLVEWLSELAYLAERDRVVFRTFEIAVATPVLSKITAWGARAPQLQKHIKAVTYHNLEVTETADGLEAEIVFDV